MTRRYHFRLPFWVYCGLTLLVAIAAMNGGANLLYWLFGVMASGLIVSGLVSGAILVRLDIRRMLPAHGIVGQPLVVRYAVRNRNRLIPAFNLHLDERPRPGRSGWNRLMAPARAWIMHIGPREDLHGEASFLPTVRGEARFDEIRVSTSFPFGIVGRSITVSRPQRLLVHPELFPLRRRVLSAIAPAMAVGVDVTKHAGSGDDFYGLREFRAGDSMRHVAWKRTANRDQLLCIERTRPSPPKLRVVLNLLAAASGPAAADLEERAISLAASIVHVAELAGFEVGLSVIGFDVEPIPMRRNHWHRNRIMAALAAIDLHGERTRVAIPPLDSADRAGVVVVHPDRVDPSVVPGEAWHFSARQIGHLVPSGADAREPGHVRADAPEVAA